MDKTTAIVLAAGKGKRMKGVSPKVLREACGQPLIYYVLRELSRVKNIKQIIIVIGYRADQVKDAVNKICAFELQNLSGKVYFVRQHKMLGTADAVKVCLRKIKFRKVLVTCGDNPLIRSKTIASFLYSAAKKRLDCSILTSSFEGKNQLGRVFFNREGKPIAIKESGLQQGFTQKEQVVNSGTYYFRKDILLKYIGKIKQNQRKNEYFLTDIIEILQEQGKKIDSCRLKDPLEALGINNPNELCFAQEIIRKRIISRLIEKGVNIVSAQNTIIQEPVRIGKNTTIYPFTFIDKGVIIGSNCLIGPFIHLRGRTQVKDSVQLGNFLEVNRSQIGQKTKVKHFGYLGDTFIADSVNVGAGAVVANYDGKRKHKTHIRKNAFIGCDTVLVAPVTVGENAATGAGAVVVKNVGKNKVVAGIPARFLRIREQK